MNDDAKRLVKQLRAGKKPESPVVADMDLCGAELAGTTLEQLWFYRTDLRGADLSKARLSRAILVCSNFEEANLKAADL